MEREDEEPLDLGDEDLPPLVTAASLEEIPAGEYDTALASLKSFLETNHDSVENYESLTEATSYVGPVKDSNSGKW